MIHHRSRRLILLALAGSLLAMPSWGAATQKHGSSAAAGLRAVFQALDFGGAGCSMDPNGGGPKC